MPDIIVPPASAATIYNLVPSAINGLGTILFAQRLEGTKGTKLSTLILGLGLISAACLLLAFALKVER